MYSKAEVLKLFPAPGFRKHQRETLEKIVDFFNCGGRCVILKSPVGSGKSLTNVTMGLASGSAFLTTPQITLIDQYVNDPMTGPLVREVKGRSHYVCKMDNELRCDLGLCETKNFECMDRDAICPYAMAKNRALKASIALMSFTYFIMEGRHDNSSFGNRRMLIVDEAHNIGEDIVGHVSLTLSVHTLPKDVFKLFELRIRNVKSSEAARDLVAEVSMACSKKISVLKKADKLTKAMQSEYRHLKKFLASAETFRGSADDADWTFQIDTDYYGDCSYPKIVLRPLYARYFSGGMLWRRASQYILSSATFPPTFLHEVGLDRHLAADEIEWIDVPSTFPAENRPIINRACGYMTYRHKAATLPKAVKALERIIDEEAGHNVAVHCHSYDISAAIQKLISPRYRSVLMAHTSLDKQEVLERWMRNRGKVLLSVALEEGQNWEGNRCRAQVLFKVPFPHVGDKRVAVRLNEKHDWAWYNGLTLLTVEQAYGRAVRSPSDWARFYVVDSSFADLVRKCRGSLAPWFLEVLPREWRLTSAQRAKLEVLA